MKIEVNKINPSILSGLGRLAALIFIVVIMGIVESSFLSPRNISMIMSNASIMIILGVGLTITIITCGPDLSVGSILTFTAVIATIMSKQGIFFLWAFLAALLAGTIIGLLNGFLVARVGLPAFISTYGLQWALFGFAYLALEGYVQYDFEENFRFIGNGYLFGQIAMPIVVMCIVVLLGFFILRKTTLGKSFYAIGANREAAQMSGINARRTIFWAFAISGFLSALAGLVFVARMNACQSDIGKNLLLPAIAAVYMGGTRATGGQGSVFGTMVGAIIMTVVENSMNMLGVPSVWRNAIVGVLIIVTVLANLWVNKRLEKVAS
jgi:ribose/xylose/arabinose/galactoside ABC-type transport system permease subunit